MSRPTRTARPRARRGQHLRRPDRPRCRPARHAERLADEMDGEIVRDLEHTPTRVRRTCRGGTGRARRAERRGAFRARGARRGRHERGRSGRSGDCGRGTASRCRRARDEPSPVRGRARPETTKSPSTPICSMSRRSSTTGALLHCPSALLCSSWAARSCSWKQACRSASRFSCSSPGSSSLCCWCDGSECTSARGQRQPRSVGVAGRRDRGRRCRRADRRLGAARGSRCVRRSDIGGCPRRLDAARAWGDACATIDQPIVLVEPAAWLPDETLEGLLNSLPAGAEVTIVDAALATKSSGRSRRCAARWGC